METSIINRKYYIIKDTNISAQLVFGSKAEYRYVADASISPFALSAELEKMFTEDVSEAQRFESLKAAQEAFRALKPRLTKVARIKEVDA